MLILFLGIALGTSSNFTGLAEDVERALIWLIDYFLLFRTCSYLLLIIKLWEPIIASTNGDRKLGELNWFLWVRHLLSAAWVTCCVAIYSTVWGDDSTLAVINPAYCWGFFTLSCIKLIGLACPSLKLWLSGNSMKLRGLSILGVCTSIYSYGLESSSSLSTNAPFSII